MPDPIAITEKDNNRSIKVSSQALLALALDENPTTGFNWQLEPVDQSVLSPLGDHYERSGRSAIGGGGIRRFQFKAVAVGKASLRLRYRRAWETPGKSVREFAVDIVVE